jgi:hypothetical protein
MDHFLRVNVAYVMVVLAAVLLVLCGTSIRRAINKYTGATCTIPLFIDTHRWSKTNVDYTNHTLLMYCTLEITGQLRDVLQHCRQL